MIMVVLRMYLENFNLTLVAVDSKDVPRKVPAILLETEVEKAEWEAAKRRKELGIQRQKEGF